MATRRSLTAWPGVRAWLHAALLACVALATLGLPLAGAQGLVDAMRGPTPVADEAKAPLLYPTENKDIRRTRAYTMQPPTIPHKIDGYQLDRDFNRCMFCHARTRTWIYENASRVLAELAPARACASNRINLRR